MEKCWKIVSEKPWNLKNAEMGLVIRSLMWKERAPKIEAVTVSSWCIQKPLKRFEAFWWLQVDTSATRFSLEASRWLALAIWYVFFWATKTCPYLIQKHINHVNVSMYTYMCVCDTGFEYTFPNTSIKNLRVGLYVTSGRWDGWNPACSGLCSLMKFLGTWSSCCFKVLIDIDMDIKMWSGPSMDWLWLYVVARLWCLWVHSTWLR